MAYNPFEKPTNYVEDRMGGAQAQDVVKPDKIAKDAVNFVGGINRPFAQAVDRVSPQTHATESYDSALDIARDPTKIPDNLRNMGAGGSSPGSLSLPGAPQFAPVSPITGVAIDPSLIPGAFNIGPIQGTQQNLQQAIGATPTSLTPAGVSIAGAPTTSYVDTGAVPTITGTQVGNVGPAVGATVADTNFANADQSRAFQLGLAQQLQQQSMGQGPSITQEQLRQGLSKNLAASQAQLASIRGNNPLAARASLQSSATQRGDFNNQMALARLAEQQGAQSQLANVGNQLRGQDLSTAGLQQQLATTRAGFQQDAGLANMQAANQRALAQAQISAGANQRQAELQQQSNLTGAQLRQDVNLSNSAMNQQRNLAQAQLAHQAAQANADRQLQFGNQEIGRQLELSRQDLQKQVAQGQLSAGQADLYFRAMSQNAAFQQQANMANQSAGQTSNQQMLQKYGIDTDAVLRKYLADTQGAAAAQQAKGQQLNALAGVAGTAATLYTGNPAAGAIVNQGVQTAGKERSSGNEGAQPLGAAPSKSVFTTDANGNVVSYDPTILGAQG